jgi:broad specificity phosphatase PhoE
MEFWIVRHGQTVGNVNHEIQGQMEGELTPIGIKQAQLTGKALQKVQFEEAYVSNLARTMHTFQEIIAGNMAPPEKSATHQEPLLREKHGGSLHGKPLKTFANMAAAGNKPIRDFAPAEGESWNDVYERSTKFFQGIYKEKFPCTVENVNQKPKGSAPDKYLVVTHGGWIMEMYNAVNFINDKSAPSFANEARNCSIHIVRMFCKNTSEFCDKGCKGDGGCMKFKIVKKNDDSHVTI